MKNNQTIKAGDWQQIKLLSSEYKNMLEAKDRFIELISIEALNPLQRAEAEVRLAKLTGELKRKDDLIHYLMFGGEMMPNQLALPLLTVWQMYRNREDTERVKELSLEVSELKNKNVALVHTVYYLRSVAKSKGVDVGEDVL
jgi:hypothetical protein